MKRALALLLILGVQIAHAYEYKLQFTAPTNARSILVAGYSIKSGHVGGPCSYDTATGGGRAGRLIVTHHANTCSWDLFGNLLSLAPGAQPSAQPLISIAGYEKTYAIAGSSKTGVDTRGFGFVSTPSAHYSWQTGSGGYAAIPFANYAMVVDLVSDGDFPLEFKKADVLTSISGAETSTAGTAAVQSTSCPTLLQVGSVCSVRVEYKPASILCTASPYGFAYTNVHLSLVTDAEFNPSFTEGFTIFGVPLCGD